MSTILDGVKISQLPAGSALNKDDYLALSQGSLTKKILKDDFDKSIVPGGYEIVRSTADLAQFESGGKYVWPMNKGLYLLSENVYCEKPIFIQAGSGFSIVGPTFGGKDTLRMIYTYPGNDQGMIQGRDISQFQLKNVTLTSGEGVSGLPAQKLFDISNGDNQLNWMKWILMWEYVTENWADHGLLEGAKLLLQDTAAAVAWGGGYEVKNIGLNTLQTVTFAEGKNTLNSIGYKFTGVNDRVILQTGNFLLNPNETALYFDSNIAMSKALINVVTWNAFGEFFDPAGLDQTHPSIRLTQVPPLADSRASVFATAAGPINITNPGVGQYARVNISLTERQNERFIIEESVGGSGILNRIRYIGIESVKITVDAIARMSAAAGNPSAKMAIGVNGTANDFSGVVNNTPGMAISQANLTLDTNQYLELFVKNNDDGSNLILSDINLRIAE